MDARDLPHRSRPRFDHRRLDGRYRHGAPGVALRRALQCRGPTLRLSQLFRPARHRESTGSPLGARAHAALVPGELGRARREPPDVGRPRHQGFPAGELQGAGQALQGARLLHDRRVARHRPRRLDQGLRRSAALALAHSRPSRSQLGARGREDRRAALRQARLGRRSPASASQATWGCSTRR